ncbi:unnamed protein product [Effrenium voratum]|nr:unnamed protein product [Effrenium voratum]
MPLMALFRAFPFFDTCTYTLSPICQTNAKAVPAQQGSRRPGAPIRGSPHGAMAETWHHNVWMAYTYMMLSGVAFSVALGPLFDVYLYKLGGEGSGNQLVGAVESVNGAVALSLVLPVGIIVDSWDRVRLIRGAALIGLLSSLVGCWAVWSDSVPWWYATMVFTGIYTELGSSVCYALFADSVESQLRVKATATMAVINNLAFSLGPGMMLVAFLFIGDNWQMGQLRVILGIGMAVLNPLACLSLFFFTAPPSAGPAEEEDGLVLSPSKERLEQPGARAVPFLIAISDFVTVIGAGMTIKYFNLFWKLDWGMTPAQVLAISVVQPLSIAFFIKILEKPAECMGRARASFLCFVSGIVAFVVLAKAKRLPVALVAYFVRSGMANANAPFNKSILFDYTPSSQRGRWNALETLSSGVWSGSAFIGGYMADHYDYRFTFLVTAVVYAVACTIYSPLMFIVKDAKVMPEESKVPLLAYASPVYHRQSSTLGAHIPRMNTAEILASPKLQMSPGAGLRLRAAQVKSGMGIILCMLGVQLVLANILVVQPLVTCLLMMIVILVCIVLSILRGVTPQSHCAEAALES